MRAGTSIATRLLALLAVGGCNETQQLLGLTDPPPNSFAVIAAPGAPTTVPIFLQFDDVNPCSGLVHTVTFTGTASIHELPNGQVVVREQRTITTSSGFEGRGTDTFVGNGNIQKTTLNDMLTNESGERIRARFALVIDVSTGTVQVLNGSVECVRS